MLQRIGKLRLPFSYLMALLGIIFAPRHLWFPGLLLVAVGAAIRFWAAGHIVKVDKLSQGGPYAFTRNPLYLGSFVGALGVFTLVHNWWLMSAFLIGFAFFYGCTILSEEKFLSGKYGQEFTDYRKNVPMFFPRLLPNKTVGESRFSWEHATNYNCEHKSLACSVAVVILIVLVSQVLHH
jgi:protein-S-isoprenylcysteine O-methyltransferase Ste14